jgi:hypothetical protein
MLTGNDRQKIESNVEILEGHLGCMKWAKDRSALDDESVPEGAAYSQQRTLWIAKVLKQIDSMY